MVTPRVASVRVRRDSSSAPGSALGPVWVVPRVASSVAVVRRLGDPPCPRVGLCAVRAVHGGFVAGWYPRLALAGVRYGPACCQGRRPGRCVHVRRTRRGPGFGNVARTSGDVRSPFAPAAPRSALSSGARGCAPPIDRRLRAGVLVVDQTGALSLFECAGERPDFGHRDPLFSICLVPNAMPVGKVSTGAGREVFPRGVAFSLLERQIHVALLGTGSAGLAGSVLGWCTVAFRLTGRLFGANQEPRAASDSCDASVPCRGRHTPVRLQDVEVPALTRRAAPRRLRSRRPERSPRALC